MPTFTHSDSLSVQDARENLRKAIADQADHEQAVARALQDLNSAHVALRAANKAAAAYVGLDQAIDAHHLAQARAALAAGIEPDLSIPDDLAGKQEARAAALRRVRAQGSLLDEMTSAHASASAERNRAGEIVAARAADVVRACSAGLADTVRELEAEAARLRGHLGGLFNHASFELSAPNRGRDAMSPAAADLLRSNPQNAADLAHLVALQDVQIPVRGPFLIPNSAGVPARNHAEATANNQAASARAQAHARARSLATGMPWREFAKSLLSNPDAPIPWLSADDQSLIGAAAEIARLQMAIRAGQDTDGVLSGQICGFVEEAITLTATSWAARQAKGRLLQWEAAYFADDLMSRHTVMLAISLASDLGAAPVVATIPQPAE